MKTKFLEGCRDVDGAIIFGYHVNNPHRYGVVSFDENFKAISLEEKPEKPKSNYAIPGLYFYDNSVIDVAKSIKPSARGEYEITDINKYYLNENKLNVKLMGRGSVWLDSGTTNSLLKATQYVHVIEEREGRKIGCIEEAAYRMKLIDKNQLMKIADSFKNNPYGNYLRTKIL